jgi:pSer/pThr/pTyr-binding forkhead associated (FHA) protein
MDDTRTADFVPLRLRLQPGDHVIDLTAPDVLLGRQSDADLRMPQPDVSRQHCRFQFAHGGWRVVDLDSLNGVYVNGDRVRRAAVIHSGDHIRICGIEFDVEMPVAGSVPRESPEGTRTTTVAVPQQTIHRMAS